MTAYALRHPNIGQSAHCPKSVVPEEIVPDQDIQRRYTPLIDGLSSSSHFDAAKFTSLCAFRPRNQIIPSRSLTRCGNFAFQTSRRISSKAVHFSFPQP
jgi:hypothetical protein